MKEIDIQELLAPDTFRLGSAEDERAGRAAQSSSFRRVPPVPSTSAAADRPAVNRSC